MPEVQMENEQNKQDGKLSKTSNEVRPLGIPKPIPRGGSTTAHPEQEPISEDTIQINKSVKTEPPQKNVVDMDSQKRLKIFCYNCRQKLDLTDMTPFSKIDCPSCSSPIIVPRWFDNYLLEELCGVGGMAVVYRGLDLALDREVAIKILNKESAANEGKNKLFLHEARTVATLNHFAILPIYTCGEYEGQAYFVMQYMSGGSLDVEIANAKGGGLPVDEVSKWLKDVAEGLDNAKRHGIVHHDIKPGNFLLDGERNVKIGDFGISQALHGDMPDELNEIAASWGSPQYVSPEKALTGTESHFGDIYSLGATFYHALTGVTPYDNDDPKELLKMKTIRDPLHISKHNPDLPPPLCDLIMSMMHRTPEARPTYRDIIAELNSIKKKNAKKTDKPSGKVISGNPKKRTNKTLSRKTSGQGSVGRNLTKKKNSWPSLIIQTILFVTVLGVGYHLWSNGYLAEYIPGAPKPRPASYDYLPDVTKSLSEGRTRRAIIESQDILGSIDETLEVKKQAALQLALAIHLTAEPNPESKCRAIAEKLKNDGLEIDAPELALLSYLSKPSYSSDRLRRGLKTAGPLILAAEIAVMLKNLKLRNQDAASEVRDAYKRYNTNLRSFPDESWEKCFKTRVKSWYNWIFTRRGDKSTLEKLIASSDLSTYSHSKRSSESAVKKIAEHTQQSVKELTPRIIRAANGFAAKRPRPASFDFSERQLAAYFSSLPKNLVTKERRRSEQITPLKQHLCAMMFHMPYSGREIQLRNGKTLRGKVMANNKYLSVRLKGGGRKRIKWSELAPAQLARMLAYFAKTRVEMGKKKEGAEDYLRAALFSDWYGNYDDAAKYAKAALQADASITNKVANLLER